LVGPVSSAELLNRFHEADVFVFPSYFEGFALALLEAMACGLPVISSEILSGMELLSQATGREIYTGDTDALVEALRWFSANREKIPAMKTAARSAVEKFTWENYRRAVSSECKVFT
jgi:glycosyltransferase involved in cell wall biosynthesis